MRLWIEGTVSFGSLHLSVGPPYRVQDPAALEQLSELLFCVCFDLQVNFYTCKLSYSRVTNPEVLVDEQNQFTASLSVRVRILGCLNVCCCALCLDHRLYIFL